MLISYALPFCLRVEAIKKIFDAIFAKLKEKSRILDN